MIRTIVVGTDGSETAKKAVAEAAELGAAVGAKVTVVSAFKRRSDSDQRGEADEAPDDVRHRLSGRSDADEILQEAKASIEEKGIKDVDVEAEEGDPADAIIEVAEKHKADLIVVGNKGMTGARRFLLGSVPNKVSHHAPCSVLIVRTT